MMEILNFIFSSFWIWLGVILMLGVIFHRGFVLVSVKNISAIKNNIQKEDKKW